MSLDVYLTATVPTTVFSANITHNLNSMAEAAGIYEYLWRPDELGITKAGELIAPLEKGLRKMKRNPKRYKLFNSPNGWGTYDDFVPWIEEYLAACKQYPQAEIEVSR
jgi:hypothetical protein